MEEPPNLGTRDRILWTAMTMIGEDASTSLSVRAVAARAGVSSGSLRYHFPTQRALQDAVLTGLYDVLVPDGRIHETHIPPRDRLVDCLRQVLEPAGVGEQSRKGWLHIVENFIASEPTPDVRDTYLSYEREGQRRVSYWLTVLVDEGALVPGDNDRRARFLNTVIDGLSIQRALPAEESILRTETETLYMAVDFVLGSRE